MHTLVHSVRWPKGEKRKGRSSSGEQRGGNRKWGKKDDRVRERLMEEGDG